MAMSAQLHKNKFDYLERQLAQNMSPQFSSSLAQTKLMSSFVNIIEIMQSPAVFDDASVVLSAKKNIAKNIWDTPSVFSLLRKVRGYSNSFNSSYKSDGVGQLSLHMLNNCTEISSWLEVCYAFGMRNTKQAANFATKAIASNASLDSDMFEILNSDMQEIFSSKGSLILPADAVLSASRVLFPFVEQKITFAKNEEHFVCSELSILNDFKA